MSTRNHSRLWEKFAKSKKYREEFVASQVKQSIPFQIRAMMKQRGMSQEELATKSGVDQSTISRAIDPEYGKLNLATIIKIAGGFDVAFIGRFVPFSELDAWLSRLDEEAMQALPFDAENELEQAIARDTPQDDRAAIGSGRICSATIRGGAVGHLSRRPNASERNLHVMPLCGQKLAVGAQPPMQRFGGM